MATVEWVHISKAAAYQLPQTYFHQFNVLIPIPNPISELMEHVRTLPKLRKQKARAACKKLTSKKKNWNKMK